MTVVLLIRNEILLLFGCGTMSIAIRAKRGQ